MRKFYIGQKVVALDDYSSRRSPNTIKKGQIVVIENYVSCGCPLVQIKGVEYKEEIKSIVSFYQCNSCKKRVLSASPSFHERNFEPLKNDEETLALEEVIESFKEIEPTINLNGIN